jgi:SAM-dependent methyltransferase
MRQHDPFDLRNVRYEKLHGIMSEDFEAFAIAAGISTKHRILDVGCGYGACSRELLKRLSKEPQHSVIIDLIDRSLHQLELSKKELRRFESLKNIKINRFNKQFPDEACCPKEEYDLITAKMVLHEVPYGQQRNFLARLLECLEPNGTLLFWEFCLPQAAQTFITQVIRKKDELAGYNELVNRRYFCNERELSSYFSDAGFAFAIPLRIMRYQFDTYDFLDIDFHNDSKIYDEWLSYIRREAQNSLFESGRGLLDLRDRNDRIEFTIPNVLIFAKRPGPATILLKMSNEVDQKINLSHDESPEKVFLQIVKQNLTSGGTSALQGSRKSLFRPAILTRAYDGQPQLCKDGFEFVCNYNLKSQDVLNQCKAYLEYLTAFYCFVNAKQKTDGTAGISQTLTQLFREDSGAGWLSIKVIEPSDPMSPIEIVAGGVNVCAGIAAVHFADTEQEFFNRVNAQIGDTFKPVFENIANSSVNRLLGPNGQSFDTLAMQLAKQVESDWADTRKTFVKQQKIVTVMHNRFVDGLLKFVDTFRVIQQYLIRSGTPVCYYFCPPSLITNNRRLEEGALLFSTDSVLDPAAFESLLAFVTRLWNGLGTIEAQLSERFEQLSRKEQELTRQQRLLFSSMVHGTTTSIKSINAFGLCETLFTRIPPRDKDDLRTQIAQQDHRYIQELMDYMSRALVGEDTALALVTFIELCVEEAHVPEKFQNPGDILVSEVLIEAEKLAKAWTLATSTTDFAPIIIESTQAYDNWLIPRGYLDARIIRGTFIEIFRNAAFNGYRSDDGSVRIYSQIKPYASGGVAIRFTNKMSKGAVEGKKSKRTGFLERLQRAMSGLTCAEVRLHFGPDEERQEFSTELILGPIKSGYQNISIAQIVANNK